MRKLICIFTFIFIISACNLNLQWPKEIEIKKETPELRFKADIDDFELSSLFDDLEFDFGHDASIKVIDCENTETLTLIVYALLFEGSVEEGLPSEIKDLLSTDIDGIIPPSPDRIDLALTTASIDIKAPELKSPLDQFTIKPLQTKVYLSGSNDYFLDRIGIDLLKNGNPVITEPIGKSQPSSLYDPVSGEIADEYSGTALPASNNSFELSLDNDFDVDFCIYLKEGQEIDTSKFRESLSILVELAIWFPFEFIAGPTAGDIKLPLDDLFDPDPDNDILGRESEEDEGITEYLENIYIEMVLNRNPFPNASLVAKSGAQEIISSITDRVLRISIDKEDINYPFNPSLFIRFQEGDEVIVPRIFNMEDFAFKAKLKYTWDVPKYPDGWL